ncbi:MAG: DUF4340 domain-containing protein [Acidobacteriota bacterium]
MVEKKSLRYGTTIILFILLVFLLFFLYFFELPRREKEKKIKGESQRLLALDEGNFQRLTILKGERRIVLSRGNNDDAWFIEQPISDKADSGEISSLISYLGSFKFDRIVEENSGNLKKYGLDAPELSVQLDIRGQASKTMKVGRRSPIGEGRYLAVEGDPRIYLVHGSLVFRLDRDSDHFRDKNAFDIVFESVKCFVLQRSGETIKLERNLTEWEVTAPDKSSADREKVENMLRRICSLWIEAFHEVNPSDLSVYGLEEPVARVSLRTDEGEQTLLLGNERKEAGSDREFVYAKRAERPGVFSVRRSILDDLNFKAQDFIKSPSSTENLPVKSSMEMEKKQ